MLDDLITTKQLCEWLGISENTAYNYRKIQGLPFLQLTRKTIKYDKDEVRKWLKEKGIDLK